MTPGKTRVHITRHVIRRDEIIDNRYPALGLICRIRSAITSTFANPTLSQRMDLTVGHADIVHINQLQSPMPVRAPAPLPP